MRATRLTALTGLSVVTIALGGCDGDELAETIDIKLESLMQGEAVASDGVGFTPQESYPYRSTQYDDWLPLTAPPEINEAQLNRLFYHVAMPQSHEAMVSLLGYPIAEQGDYVYWAIEGSSSELAVRYSNDHAINYTVGY